MNKPAWTIIITLSFFLLPSGCGPGDPPISGKVPVIVLPRFGGGTGTIKPDPKNFTLLVFWATWCQPCIMEIPELVKLNTEFSGKGLRIVSILTDQPDLGLVQKLHSELGINYEVLLGDQETTRKFGGVTAIPTSFIISPEGKILEKIEGMMPGYILKEKINNVLPPH